MKMRKLALLVMAAVLIQIGILLAPAYSHMPVGTTPAPQTIVTHPDATISAAASPTPALAANPNRVTARCQNTGAANTLRVGDSSISNTQGTVLYPAAASTPIFPNTVDIDTTAAVYLFSQSGTVGHCDEIVRP